MSDQPSKRKVLFEEPAGREGELSPAARGEITLGEALARAREARGLTLSEVAQHLRIRESYLQALEEGQHGHLPGATYAIGFIRSYAALLGLEAEEAVAIFKAAREDAGNGALNFPEPVAESRIPRGAVLFVSVLMAAAAYGGWYYMSSNDMAISDLVPEVPASLRGSDAPAPVSATVSAPPPVEAPPARVADEPPPPQPGGAAIAVAPAGPASETVASPVAPAPSAAPMPSAAPAPAEPVAEAPAAPPPVEAPPAVEQSMTAPEPAPVPAPGPVAEAPPAPPPVPAPAPAPAATAETAPSVTEAGQAPPQQAAAATDIEILAKADSWVQIREPGGRVVVMRIFRKGDTYKVPDEKGLTLMTGNAGAIEIRVGGKAVPAIGPFGAVRRDVALDATALREGRAVPR